ncbi:hypothetical protein [Caldilinea sp.]|uniref:hypothetical protein n=1 Tax=Caldilinea sp. TaxID=2293560 RepID=UPI0021DD4E8E|nr:hypothetical protein [Caldilinea sp.]GIV71375.1 MAG: hypothetical protein KatS3mg048_4237 [Caldilinea sp.]
MFWMGIVLIASGIFLLVYGGLLFRFSLAVGFFVLGFSLASWSFSGQEDVIRILISLVVGGVLAGLGYALVRIVLHTAGALLGAVLMLLLLSLLPVKTPEFLSVILIAAGLGVVGYFGDRLGDWAIILATSLAGAYAIVLGLTRMFPAAVEVGADYASAYVPFTGPAFAVFVIVFLIGALAQDRIRSVRGRYVNR